MRSVPTLAAGAALYLASALPASGQIATGGAPQPPTDPGAEQAAGAAVMVMRQICLPLIEGAQLKTIAPRVGLREEHGDWVYPIDRNQRIQIASPDPTNPHVCSVTIIHDVGAQPAIRQAVDNWARSQAPPLQAVKARVQTQGPLYLRTTSTWSGPGSHGVLGVVFAGEKTLEGKPVDGAQDQSELMASLTPSTS